MIWHSKTVLESVCGFRSLDLFVLDMGLICGLLCVGDCHWAIYVALHTPNHDDFPNIHGLDIWDIFSKYCEIWSTQHQTQFIEELGIPSAWLHEAQEAYFNHYGDWWKALENLIDFGGWQRSHMICTTSVTHSLLLSGSDSEIRDFATSVEDHKSEMENWDMKATIYISFYVLRILLQEKKITSNELDILDSKNDACKDFFGWLNESLNVWGDKFHIDARVAYSMIPIEIGNLPLSDSGDDDSARDVQLSCFKAVFTALVLEDVRSHHLQDAVSFFTCYLPKAAAS